MLLSQLRAYSDAVTAAEHHLLCTPMLHIPGLLVVSPAANSSCARIPRCRRLAYTVHGEVVDIFARTTCPSFRANHG